MYIDKNDAQILNIYVHGSRVYGTNTEQSDYDYIVVVEDSIYKQDSIHYNNEDYNIFSKSQWDNLAQDNDCDFIECIYLPSNLKIKETYIPEYNIQKELIRKNFSAKASNSWVKCKKKLTVEKDYAPYIGKKSLWHSLRLLDFGIQILSHGSIIDYTSMNSYYTDIMNASTNDWLYFKEKYQPIYNSYKSKFRSFD